MTKERFLEALRELWVVQLSVSEWTDVYFADGSKVEFEAEDLDLRRNAT